jgi:hypothetical protein
MSVNEQSTPPMPDELETSKDAGEAPGLAYESDPARKRRTAGGFSKGCTIALSTGLLCFGLLFMAGAENFEDSPPGVWSAVGLIVPPVVLVAMLVYAFLVKRRNDRPRYAAGLFVGLGLSALPVGWCYAGVAEAVLR